LSTERKVELASLIQRMHECKILTKPYQDSISEEERCSREFHKKCEEAKKKLVNGFGLPIYIFEKLDRDLWTNK
jgi:hypothetical protein